MHRGLGPSTSACCVVCSSRLRGNCVSDCCSESRWSDEWWYRGTCTVQNSVQGRPPIVSPVFICLFAWCVCCNLLLPSTPWGVVITRVCWSVHLFVRRLLKKYKSDFQEIRHTTCVSVTIYCWEVKVDVQGFFVHDPPATAMQDVIIRTLAQSKLCQLI